ncbi:MAG: TonB-dependent receptor [Deltaproteobacteria bacterium]|nr:TonB-dependent receptor [Deltaproteobacteria bacterium]
MKLIITITALQLFTATAFADDRSRDTSESGGAMAPLPPMLVTAGEEGYRPGGICPYRKDSPAFHFEPADRGIRLIPQGEFDSSAVGGMAFLNKSSPAIPAGPHASISGGLGSFITTRASLLGSYGTKAASIMAGYGHRRADSAQAGGGGQKSDVYPSGHDARYRDETRSGTAYESHAGYMFLKLSPSDSLDLSLSWLQIEAENIRYPMLKQDGISDTSNAIEISARLKQPVPAVRAVRLAGYWRSQEQLLDNRLREAARLYNGSSQPFSTQNMGKVFQYGARISATVPTRFCTSVAGADYGVANPDAVNRKNNGTVLSESPMLPDVTIETVGVFLTCGTAPTEKLSISGGLRGDMVSARAGKAPNAPSTEYAEPSGWLRSSWRPQEGLELAIAFGSSLKYPTPQELYMGVVTPSSQLGNPQLAQARSYRPEFSLDYRSSLLALHGYAFWSRIDGYIALYQLNPTTRSYRNVEAELWGAGVSAELKLVPALKLDLSLKYNHGDVLTWSRPLPETEPLTGSASIGYDNGRHFASLTERFSSRQWRTDRSIGEQSNPSWAVTDIKAGYRSRNLILSIGIDNLADTRYSTHLLHLRDPLATGIRTPESGRLVWGMLEIFM